MGRGSRQKALAEGELVNTMIFILPITKLFDKINACNLVCELELTFP